MKGTKWHSEISILVVILLIIAACGQTPEDARRELGKMNITYSDESFIECIKRSDILAVKLFVAAGKNFKTTWDGNTAWTTALLNGNDEIANYFLKEGNLDKDALYSGILLAVNRETPKILIALINILGIDNEFKEALFLAAASFNGRTDTVKFFKEKGININAVNKNGSSALMIAAYNGAESTVKYLIENKASINQKDIAGRTALMYACIKGNAYIVKTLIDNGAEINAVSKSGETAIIVAKSYGYNNIVNMLKAER